MNDKATIFMSSAKDRTGQPGVSYKRFQNNKIMNLVISTVTQVPRYLIS